MTQQPHTLPIEDRLRARKSGWASNITYKEGAGDLTNPDGPQAADIIAALYGALEGIRWKSADRDNMEFAATITCWQRDKIMAALSLARGER